MSASPRVNGYDRICDALAVENVHLRAKLRPYLRTEVQRLMAPYPRRHAMTNTELRKVLRRFVDIVF